jgi:uncharacterized phage-associated protein
MIVRHQNEKVFNAITYFTEHTSMCNKKKTYKLLWLLDSEHFQAIGRSVTGYQYFAWRMGPVPTALHEAIDSDDPNLTDAFDIQRTFSKGHETITLVPKRPFDPKVFSKKELAILEDLANRFDMMTGDEMEKWTHQPGTPWHQVWEIEGRHQAEISYEYVINLSNLPREEKETISHIARDREDFVANYQ